jgi:hydrogenase maturation protease
MKKCLLIGFGNTIRRDDALGPRIVDAFETNNCSGMEIVKISIPQIDLTLAEILSRSELAIFVDARTDDFADPVKVEHCKSTRGATLMGHSSHSLSIPDLLNLTLDLYGSAPDTYIVMPKGFDFTIGEELSPDAEVNAKLAIQAVASLFDSVN